MYYSPCVQLASYPYPGYDAAGMPQQQGQQPFFPQQTFPPQAFPQPGAPQMFPPMATPQQPSGSRIPGTQAVTPAQPGAPFVEESYIENILRLNLGKVATIYMTFENNTQWNAKIFRGVLEAAGRDHIIISDPQTGRRFLLLMVNLDYITFDEELNYLIPPQIQGPTTR